MKQTRISMPEYRVWKSMRSRCRDKKSKNSKTYLLKGITVSKEWDDFLVFFNDMGKRPSKYHQIDRIDNNSGYSKENCKWETRSNNSLNRPSPKRSLLRGVYVGERVGGIVFGSSIKIQKKLYHLGYFTSEADAHEEYLKIYKEWYGKNPAYLEQ